MIKVNIDLDNVVYPWSAAMAFEVFRRGITTDKHLDFWAEDAEGEGSWDGFDFVPYPEPRSWAFWTSEWGVPHGEFMRVWRQGIDSGEVFGGRYASIPGAREALWRLSDAGVYIRLVTTRLGLKHNHKAVLRNTAKWLDEQTIPYRSISFLGPEESKADYRADYAIDDHPGNVAEMREAGIEAMLLDRRSNQGEDATWRGTWADFEAEVLS